MRRYSLACRARLDTATLYRVEVGHKVASIGAALLLVEDVGGEEVAPAMSRRPSVQSIAS